VKRWLTALLLAPLLMAAPVPVPAFDLGDLVGAVTGDDNAAETARLLQKGAKVAAAMVPISDEEEIRLGRGVAARVIARFGIDYDRNATYYLNLLGTVLAQRSPRPDIPYHFAVLNTDDVNAYACPGGYIFVTRGALKMVRDEAELAAVLAHEIGHVTGRHIVKALQHSEVMKAGADLAGEALAKGSGELFSQMVDVATDALFKGLKKEDEYDADARAVALLDRVGYDYPAMFDVLKLLDARRKAGQAKVLARTHPAPRDRIRHLKQAMRKMRLDSPTGIRLRARLERHLQQSKASS